MVDISEWTDLEFYDLCWYWDTPNDWEIRSSEDGLVFTTAKVDRYATVS